MKRKLLLFSAILICLAISVSGTVAYFTAEKTAHNVITSGYIDIELVERSRTSDGTLVSFPEEGIANVMPGASVSKLVSVRNAGSREAWLRLGAQVRIISKTGQELPVQLQGGVPAVSYTVDSGKWILHDGWYYYEDEIGPGEITEPLFKEVSFSSEIGNEYQGCKAYIEIVAQAVQTANNGGIVMEAVGWPAEGN